MLLPRLASSFYDGAREVCSELELGFIDFVDGAENI